MSMHAKTDSDMTSLSPSSPTRSPRRPVYYVQSPSRDSHDGEKTTNSFHSSPVLSPMGSPGRHSRHSSSTRFSGSLKPGSRKAGDGSSRHHHRKGEKQGRGFDAIEEEGLLDDDDANRGLPRRCYFLAFIVGFFVLFSFFSLVLWGASRNQKPIITMQSISFDQFVIQAGNDFSGVATKMVTMNSTVKLIFRNKGTFFGVHVTSTPLDLSYYQLTLATGTIKKFYQSRKSHRTITVTLPGNMIPLYGGGADLSSQDGSPTAPVPLTLSFMVQPRASPMPIELVQSVTHLDFSHRSLTSLDKKNKRLWSTKDWRNKVQSFAALFRDLQSFNHLNNHSRVLCVSAGAGQEVMALKQIGVKDVTGVELVDSPPLVSRADPHNLPFFDGVFDLGFSAHLDQALFPSRFAAELERTVRVGGVCVVAVDECGDTEVKEVAKLFPKSRFDDAKNVTLIGSKMTRIILRISTTR